MIDFSFHGSQELLFAFAQVQDHVGAARGLVDRLDLEVADAFAAPAHAFIGRQRRRGAIRP